MKIKRLYEDDVDTYEEDLVPLLRSCYDGNYDVLITDDFCLEKLRGLRQYLRDGKAFLFGVIDDSGRLAGFDWGYEVRFLTERRYHSAYSAIAPWAAGQGWFTELYRVVEADAHQMGYTCVELAASAANEKVCTIYKKYGYEAERIYFKKNLGGTTKKTGRTL